MVRMERAAALRAHLVSAGLAGTVATTREKSLRRYRQFAARDPRALLGLDPRADWGVPRLLSLMADGCGVSADPRHVSGPDRIDPDRTVSALDVFAQRLAAAAGSRSPVLLGTGHPHRLLGFYAALARALADAGCAVLTPARGHVLDLPTRFGAREHLLCYEHGVALVRGAGAGCAPGAPGAHTHSPLPLRTALAAAARTGGPLPELVIGDHGWVCGAGELGIDAIGPADTDDPALFVGHAEGRVSVVVPLDDGLPPPRYAALTRYVLQRSGLSQ
jgi:hypothetical protein